MTDKFVSWHNHTSYSMLDGASRVQDLVSRASELGMSHLAISDHGVLYGLIDFYRECEKQGIGPILGSEFYHAEDRTVREKVSQQNEDGVIDGSNKRYYHLSVYARNNTGYSNLIKLSSDAFLNGMFYKPRTDNVILAEHSEGLIVGTGCLGGEVLQKLMHENFDGALRAAANLQEIVGKENMFVEVMDHGLPEQARTNPQLIAIARKLNAPILATMDSHYVRKEDALSHDALLCCQTHSKLSDEKRFRFSNDQYYLKSPEEMRHIFRELPEACTNTFDMAERVEVQIDFNTLHLPHYEPPEGFDSPSAFLRFLASKGLEKRYNGNVPQSHYDRLAYELTTIEALGLSSYFLIVWDLVKFADRQGIRRGPARGSVAGALVAYCMDISRVDPMRHGLLFERFLNPSRIALPDIDLDFDTRYRDTLIQYTIDKYGSNRVAQIITFSKIRARAAVRDAARVLGYERSVGDSISRAMPDLIMGEATPLHACLNKTPRWEAGYNNAEGLRQMYAADPDIQKIVDVAVSLEGLIRQDSVHAAGVVITPDEITNYVPVQRKSDGPICTQYEKNTIEDLGLLKMDYLGLKNLDIISDTLLTVQDDPRFNAELFSAQIANSKFDDFNTFNLLREGNTIGVFQLESKPMRQLLQRLQPNSIDDIAAVVALYRPGPMGSNMHNDYADRKNGRQPVTYFHEDAKEFLEKSQGLMIFQESVMQLAQKFAGYSMVDADGLRKIIGKKLIDKMKAEKDKFVQGCLKNGYSEQLATELFDSIESFASYAFNASHAYGYAYISYQTAFLKANYPAQYMAALCSAFSSKLEKSAVFLDEARRMGLTVETPDINTSMVGFTATDKTITVGLAAIKNVGEDFAQKIVDERENGPYTSLINFVERINPNASQCEAFALSGAFDQFGTRLGISSVSRDILSHARKAQKKVIDGQGSMFDIDNLWDFEIPTSEFGLGAMLENEKDSMGLYISGHPLDSFVHERTDWSVIDLADLEVGTTAQVLGHLTEVSEVVTRAGDRMARVTVSDQTGSRELVCFPRSFRELILRQGAIGILKVKAGTDYQGERNYILQGFQSFDSEQDAEESEAFHVFLPTGFAQNDAAVSKLKGLLLTHYGNHEVILKVSKATTLALPSEIRVEVTSELIGDLRNLFEEFSRR